MNYSVCALKANACLSQLFVNSILLMVSKGSRSDKVKLLMAISIRSKELKKSAFSRSFKMLDNKVFRSTILMRFALLSGVSRLKIGVSVSLTSPLIRGRFILAIKQQLQL